MLVNRIDSIAGTVDLINNMIQRHAPRDMVKVSGYSGGASSATQLTPAYLYDVQLRCERGL